MVHKEEIVPMVKVWKKSIYFVMQLSCKVDQYKVFNVSKPYISENLFIKTLCNMCKLK